VAIGIFYMPIATCQLFFTPAAVLRADQGQHLPYGPVQPHEHRTRNNGMADAHLIDLGNRAHELHIQVVQPVAGFGAGAALISQSAGYLISAQGYTPYAVFGLLGYVFLVMATGAGLFMKFPGEISEQQTSLLPYKEILRRSEFRILYAVMIVALAAGFSVNANMKELFPSGGAATGIMGVSLFAVANAVGRLAWGAFFDRTSASIALRANLIAQAIVLLASPWLLASEPGFLILAVAAGFNYGGVLVLYAATVTHVWGAERVGQVYGMLFSANIAAAPAPMLAGLWYDATNDFAWFFCTLSFLLVFSAVAIAKKGKSALR